MRLDTTQDFFQATGLAFIRRKNRDGIPFDLVMDDIIGQQLEILGENRLRQNRIVAFFQNIVAQIPNCGPFRQDILKISVFILLSDFV